MAKSSNWQIKFGAIISYLAIAFNVISGLIYTPWMLKQIGDSNYGLYTLATSIISVFTIDFGMSSAVARFVSKYRAEERQEKINSFLGLVYKLYIIIDIVLMIVLTCVFFSIEHFATGLTSAEMPHFKVVFVIAAIYSVISFPFVTLNGILASYEKFVQMKLCDMFNKIITIIITVVALYNGMGLYALVIINVSCNLISIVMKLYFVKCSTPVKVRGGKASGINLGEIFGFSLWTTVVSFSKRFIQNIMPSIISMVSNTAEIAIYGIGSVIESYAYLMVSAITGMFMPKISRIVVAEDKEDKLNKLMCKIGRYQYFVMGLIFVGFAIVGKQFIVLCYTEHKSEAYYVALFMIFPQLFYAPQQIAQTTVTVENKVKLQAFVHVFVAIINVIIAYPLTKLWGAVGATFSICIVYFIRMVIMNVIYHKTLHINMLNFYNECYFKMAPPIIITLIMGFFMNQLIFKEQYFNSAKLYVRWGMLVSEGLVVVCMYLGLMWLLALNGYEKGTVKSVFEKIFMKKK